MSLLPLTRRRLSRGSARLGVLFALGAGAALGAGCSDRTSSPASVAAALEAPGAGTTSSAGASGPAQVEPPPLEMSHQQITARLGPHTIKCSATLVSTSPRAGKKQVDEEVTLRINGQGHFEGTKNTHEQYGQQVIWTGDWLFSRLRHSPYTRRRPDPKEPPKIADRMVGLLPAYARLLRRFLEVKPEGKGRHLDRDVLRFSLGKAAHPRPAERGAPLAQKWRETIAVTALTGTALLDEKTRVPLSVKLEARWTFSPPVGSPPAPTGIPTKIAAAAKGSMELRFTQELADIGQDQEIKPPPRDQVTEKLDRVRLELERQMLTEERPINKKNIRYPQANKQPAGESAGAKK